MNLEKMTVLIQSSLAKIQLSTKLPWKSLKTDFLAPEEWFKLIQGQLERSGFLVSRQEILDWLEHYSPQSSAGALGIFLNFFRPFTQGLGLRVSRLGDEDVEIVIPSKARNLNSKNLVHESLFAAASIEGAQLILQRHLGGEIECQLKQLKIEIRSGSPGDLRLALHWEAVARELFLRDFRQGNSPLLELKFKVLTAEGLWLGDVDLQMDVEAQLQIGGA